MPSLIEILPVVLISWTSSLVETALRVASKVPSGLIVHLPVTDLTPSFSASAKTLGSKTTVYSPATLSRLAAVAGLLSGGDSGVFVVGDADGEAVGLAVAAAVGLVVAAVSFVAGGCCQADITATQLTAIAASRLCFK